jgi:hypothetical protein
VTGVLVSSPIRTATVWNNKSKVLSVLYISRIRSSGLLRFRINFLNYEPRSTFRHIPSAIHLTPEDGGSMFVRNFRIRTQHYKVPQPEGPIRIFTAVKILYFAFC